MKKQKWISIIPLTSPLVCSGPCEAWFGWPSSLLLMRNSPWPNISWTHQAPGPLTLDERACGVSVNEAPTSGHPGTGLFTDR